MKQTAVEWLVEQLENHNAVTREGFEKCIKQAKEMEKQQMIEMHDKGFDSVEQLNDEFIIEVLEYYHNNLFFIPLKKVEAEKILEKFKYEKE